MKQPITYSLLALALALAAPAQGQRLTRTPGPSQPVGPVEPIRPLGDYTLLIDSLIQNLDKSRVPTGILYDRALGLAGLATFAPGQSSSGAHFRQSYYDLWMAAYTRPAALLPHTQRQLVALAEKQLRAGLLPVGVLDARFAVLDTLGEDRGSIVERGGLYYDGVPGLTPYLSRNLCLIAPLADTTTAATTFTLPQALLLQNTGRQLSSVQVQVDNLTFTLTPGGSYAANLGTGGTKTVRFTAAFSDGTVSQAQAVLYVRPAVASRITSSERSITPNLIGRPWTGYDGATTYGEGNARRYFNTPASQNDEKLRNVVVVLDGYDPSDRRDIDQIAREFAPLMQAFRQPGRERDVVILNFPRTDRQVQTAWGSYLGDVDGGADYIERNALVLVELLAQLKPLMNDPTQKVTVVGPSMGGLVSRYALALMEKNFAAGQGPYWQHNVDTWISLDAPHGGANVPLGDQYFLDYFAGVSDPARDNLARLSSVAAKQMLVNHFEDQNGDEFRKPFLRSLLANGLAGSAGYPTQLRRVGLSNGALDGALNTNIGYAGQTGVQLDVVHNGSGRGARSFFYRSTEPGAQISANMYFSPGPGQTGAVFDGQARAIVAAAKDVRRRIHREMTSNGNGSYDLAPGGTYDSQGQIRDRTVNGRQVPGYSYAFSLVRPLHDFIPTVSALAYQYRNAAAYNGSGLLPFPYTNLSTRALVCNDETPFDAVYAEIQFSTPHVSLGPGAQQFLSRELYNITQPARFAASNVRSLCQGSTAAIALADCVGRPGTATYAWTLTGPGVFASTSSTSVPSGGVSQSVSATSGAGLIVVSVVVTRPGAGPSPATTWTLSAVDGGYVRLASSSQNEDVCIGTTVTVTATPLAGATITGWRVVNGYLVSLTGDEAQVQVSNAPGTTTVYADYNATCPGSSGPAVLQTAEISIGVVNNLNGFSCVSQDYSLRLSGAQQAVYPDPADGYVNIRSPFAPARPYRLTLFNDRGGRVYAETAHASEVRVDTHTFPIGLYHLTLRQGTDERRFNLSIQR